MKKTSSAIWIILTIFMFIFISGGCIGSGDDEDGDSNNNNEENNFTQIEPAVYQSGEDILVISKTIGTSGGTIEAGNIGTPIDRVKVYFPPETLQSDTEISLGYNFGSMTPNGNDWDETVRGTWNGSAITLKTNGTSNFDIPIEITIPWNGARYGIIAPYYVEEDGKLNPCQVTKISDYEQTVTFTTSHISNFICMTPAFDVNKSVTVPNFTPRNNGFTIDNFGDGVCFGMAAYSIWYWKHGSETLRERFSEDQQRDIATISQNTLKKNLELDFDDDNLDRLLEGNDDFRKRRLLQSFVPNSGPVMIYMKGKATQSNVVARHQVVLFTYTTDRSSGRIDFGIYDPNHPGEHRHIFYDDIAGAFEPYTNESATYTSIGYAGAGSFPADVERVFLEIVNTYHRSR